jgi:RNA polymerase sigma-70 factor (ECF subfamily)
MAVMDRTTALTVPEEDLEQAEDDGLRFEDFFEVHYVALFRALWLITHDRSEAEDVMQDAFLRLWERWDRVGTMKDPVGYLYRTAMNGMRSRRRRALLSLRRALADPPSDDGLAAVEGRDAVLRALIPLTPRQRAVVVLTHVLGLTSAEAAEALGIRPSTVRVLAARAKAVLRRELEEEHGQAE